MVIIPGKNFLGQRGFPTPNAAIETSACRTFRVPADDDWLGLLMGAVELLTNEWAYYQWGTLTPEESAAAWQGIFNQAYADSITPGACDIVPAPYWDESSGDDADDDAPADDQTWFGELLQPPTGLEWHQQVGYWAITAFVAIAATPAAAISFTVLAKKMVLAFQKHDAGGVARVFVDATEVGSMDTYSASDAVGEMTVVIPDVPMGFMPLDVETHTLWVALDFDATEGQSIRVIRKRLSESEVQNPDIEYDPDTNTVKRTYDGGVTFVDYPQGDPRSSTSFLLPARTGTDIRCDAAANAVKWLKDFIDQVAGLLTEGAAFLTIVNAILYLFDLLADFAVLLQLLSDLAETLLGIGAAALTAAFTSTEYDALLCIFYCNMDAQGRVSAASLAAIETAVSADLNTTAALVTNAILADQGEIGVSNAAAIGSESGDCSGCTDCLWCIDIDFTLVDGGFADDPVIGGTTTWALGAGWSYGTAGGTRGCYIRRLFTTPAIVTLVELSYTGTTPMTSAVIALTNSSYGTLVSQSKAATPTNAPVTLTNAGILAYGVRLQLGNTVTGTPSGTSHLVHLHMEGQGDPPMTGYDC